MGKKREDSGNRREDLGEKGRDSGNRRRGPGDRDDRRWAPSTDEGFCRQGWELRPRRLLLGPLFRGQIARREPRRDGEAKGTGGSDQPGCREIPLRVKGGVLGEGESETGTE